MGVVAAAVVGVVAAAPPVAAAVDRTRPSPHHQGARAALAQVARLATRLTTPLVAPLMTPQTANRQDHQQIHLVSQLGAVSGFMNPGCTLSSALSACRELLELAAVLQKLLLGWFVQSVLELCWAVLYCRALASASIMLTPCLLVSCTPHTPLHTNPGGGDGGGGGSSDSASKGRAYGHPSAVLCRPLERPHVPKGVETLLAQALQHNKQVKASLHKGFHGIEDKDLYFEPLAHQVLQEAYPVSAKAGLGI